MASTTAPGIYGPNGKQARRPVNLRKDSTAQRAAQLDVELMREDDERAVAINYGRVELYAGNINYGPLARRPSARVFNHAAVQV